LPASIVTRDFLDQDQEDFNFLKTSYVGELLGTSAQLGEGKDLLQDGFFSKLQHYLTTMNRPKDFLSGGGNFSQGPASYTPVSS